MTNQPAETTYYNVGRVTVTNTRAIFGANTYALSNITSVGSGTLTPSTGGATFLALSGFLIAGFGLVSNASDTKVICIGLGVLLLVVGVVVARSQKPSYVVKVGTAGAEQRAYTSNDKAEIEKIVAALNEAIIKRG